MKVDLPFDNSARSATSSCFDVTAVIMLITIRVARTEAIF